MQRSFMAKLLLLLTLLPLAAPLPPAHGQFADDARPAREQADDTEIETLKQRIERLEQRLQSLEPRAPVDMLRLPVEADAERLAPSRTAPIPEAMKAGGPIPFRVIRDDPKYVRPVYLKIWNSRFGRWSFLPSRVHYAQHRLFAAYDFGLSALYQLQGDLGIAFPVFQDEQSLDMYLVAFQTEVLRIIAFRNQIVVVGRPMRTGVQVVTIKTRDVRPANANELLLVQLATASGDELDYALIAYAPPDFWARQQQKAESRSTAP